jgi:hypothetical protein
MTAPILWLGLAFGFRHALEPDHVAAVASLATRSTARRGTLRIAGAWGVGHASVILVVGAAVGALGLRLPPSLAPALEVVAGTLLVLLGLDVLGRLRKVRSMAALASAAPAPSTPDPATALAALPPPRTLRRAFVVGAIHGMAGSAALTVAAIPSLPPRAGVVAWLAVFGLGSIAGMVACSFLLSVPLGAGARRLAGAALGPQLAVGAISVALGCWVAARAAW